MQARGLVTTLAAASWRAQDFGVVRSVLACGMYPLVGRLLPSLKTRQAGRRDHSQAVIVTAKAEKVLASFMHVALVLVLPWNLQQIPCLRPGTPHLQNL